MLTKTEFKQYLLTTFTDFVDNMALDDYIDFLFPHIENTSELSGYSEKHHAIPVACYKNKHGCEDRLNALKYADADKCNFQVSLLYKDHCKAHYLLYFCTTGVIKYANAETVSYMFSVYPALTKPQHSQKLFKYTESDFELLQLYMNDIKEDKDSRFWKQYEVDFLKKNYAEYGVQYCADKLNKPYSAVKSKARKLALKVNVYRYSAETKQFIREHYPVHGMRYCAEYLGLPLNTVKDLAANLGVKMNKWWSEEELSFLIDNYAELGYKKCAKQLNRSEGSVVTKAANLNLISDNSYTEEDKEFIRQHYPIEGIKFCANALGRTEEAIRHYAKILGIRRPPQGHIIYCPELDRQFNSIKEASVHLQISDGGICSVLKGRLKSYKNLHFYKGTKEDYEKRKNSN